MANDRQPIPPDRIERAAATLRPLEREALHLAAAEKLSNRVLAEALGTSPEAAERLLVRALLKLDRALERQERPWWRFW